MEHVLRLFRDKDEANIKSLILTILSKEYSFDRSTYSDSDLNSKISDTYGGSRDAFFVIEEGDSIVGTVGVKHEAGADAIMRRLFVDVKRRRHGYGAELLDAVIQFCKQKGYKRILFRCTDRMASAIALCLKKGFKEVEKLEVSGFKIHKLELILN